MGVETTAYRRISSPQRLIFKLARVLGITLTILLLCAIFMKVDIVARAPGLVVSAQSTRPITTHIRAIVKSFEVSEGQLVKKGENLVVLEDEQLKVDLQKLNSSIANYQYELLVLTSLLNDTKQREFELELQKKVNVFGELHADRWRAFYTAQIQEYRAKLDEFSASSALVELEFNAIAHKLKEIERLRDLLAEKNARIQEMVSRGVSTDFKGLDSEIEFAEIEARWSDSQSSLKLKDVEREKLSLEEARYKLGFKRSLAERLVEVGHELELSADEKKKLIALREQMTIKAPVSGIVQELAKAALSRQADSKPLMKIVPSGGERFVIASIKNQDIRGVQPGQTVELLFDAYPLATYGTTTAQIETISEDIAGLAASIPTPVNVVALRALIAEASETSTGLTYVSKLTIDRDSNPNIDIRPGLSVLANIKLGEQRAIMYFINPLVRAWHWTLKEE